MKNCDIGQKRKFDVGCKKYVLASRERNYNPEQNFWSKIEKCSKSGQGKKNLISTFACFLVAIVRV